MAAVSAMQLPDEQTADSSSKYAYTPKGASFGQPWRSDALLSFGAGLLSGKNFFQGLAQGATAAQAARRAWTNPQRNLIENGAFTLDQYPDGTTRITPNQGIQAYQFGLSKNALLAKLGMLQVGADYTAQRIGEMQTGQMARTQAMIDASDRRSANQLAQSHSQFEQMLAAQTHGGKFDSPFQKAFETSEGQAYANLPTAIAQTSQIRDQLQELDQLAQDPHSGIGPGVGLKAERALALATGKSTPNIDINKLQRADQLIKGIRMAFNKQMWKGMGQRVSNYEVKMLNAAQPTLELASGPMHQRISDMLGLTNNTLGYLGTQKGIGDRLMQGGNAAAATGAGGATSGTTSHGVSWSF
jgi:hypothetical protein